MSRILKSIQTKESEKKVISPSYKPPVVTEEPKAPEEENDANEQVNQILTDAREQAELIITNARNQAESLIKEEQEKIQQWWKEKRQEDQQIVNEANERGFQEGYQTGFEKAKTDVFTQYEDFLNNARDVLSEGYKIKEDVIQESEGVILDLAIAIAERIIKNEIVLDQEIVLDMIKDALKSSKELEQISLFVHPDRLSFLQNAREELLAELNGQVELLIFPDSSVDEGCLIKTSFGTMDAKIDTQLEQIKHVLYDLSGRRQL